MKENKFLQVIKKRWLVDGTKTILLIAIIILLFIALNIFMQKLELTPIDFSQEKLYTLTKESKDRVKDINKEVNIYFIGYEEDEPNLEFAKQYKKANEKIVAQAVDINNRPDLSQKYGIESGSAGIIVECGEKSKVLTDSDLVTYDMQTYETINIAEEKLTSAILSVSSEKVPKIYFLEGYSEFALSKNMKYLNIYMSNEVNEVETLNILNMGKIPEDCEALVITTPSKDFDDIATNAIIDYINNGGNILWLNAAKVENIDTPNVNKILNLYSIDPFDIGIIRETNSENMVMESPDLIIPHIESSEITKDLTTGTGVIMPNATKINVNEGNLSEQKITKTDLMFSSDGSYFRTNFNNNSFELAEGEEKKEFLVGAEFEKIIKEENEENNENKITSKLIIFGENYFITDYTLIQTSNYPALSLGHNKDLVLNSLAYLVERPEDIVARKSTGTVTYTATEKQNEIVLLIIAAVPILIILAGIVVWILRLRKR